MRFGHLDLPDALATCGMDTQEQGGILLGEGQTVQQFTTPGPLDFRTDGLFLLLDDCHQQALDSSNLSYLGFWHSHPPGTPSGYSLEDLTSWQDIARAMFPWLPSTHLYFPIVTGDRLRVWAMDRALNLTELTRGGD